jgi:hypothetical protein
VYAQDFSANASDAGPLLEFTGPEPSSTARIAMNDHGDFLVAWSLSGGGTAIRRLGDNSPPASFEVASSPGYSWAVDHSNDGTGLVVSASYHSGGSRVSGLWVATQTESHLEFELPQSMNDSEPATGVIARDGSAVIAWENTPEGTLLGRFSPEGMPLGQPVLLTTGLSVRPQMARAGDDLIAVYIKATQPEGAAFPTDLDIKGRRFSRDLTPIGEEFSINTRTDEPQRFPTVSAARDGSFVVTWQQGYGYASRITGISGRRFHRDGTPAGDEFNIPDGDLFTSAEPRPFVTVTDDNTFVVVWSQSLSGGNRIVARPFVSERLHGEP